MLNWRKMEPGDRLAMWAAIAIVASSMEYDEVQPSGIDVATNTVNDLCEAGMELEIGWYANEPVAAVLYDGATFLSFVLPKVRPDGCEYAAWFHAFAEARDRSVDGLSYFADSEKQYQWALAEGFRAGDEDHFADQHLWLPKKASAIVV